MLLRRLLSSLIRTKKQPPIRYRQLVDVIKENKSKRILEIGTHKGARALQMIEASISTGNNSQEVEYYGFDLFEMMTKDIQSRDPSSKVSPAFSVEEIRKKLEPTGAVIHLYRGFSTETLPAIAEQLPTMDLIFIDGSHLHEDIEKDWVYSQKLIDKKTVVIFDDYWPDGFNRNFAIGCNKVIESIDKNRFNVEILPLEDRVNKDWGVLRINFVKVTLKV